MSNPHERINVIERPASEVKASEWCDIGTDERAATYLYVYVFVRVFLSCEVSLSS